MRPVAPARAGLALAAAGALALALTGCVDDTPAPLPSGSPSSSAAAEPDPELVPGGSAQDNLPYFDLVLRAAVDEGATRGGQFLDALEEAGFERGDMEVTADRTTVDLEADSVQFSVLMNGSCLVGQHGSNVGLRTAALPVLATGRCLVGETEEVG